LDGASAVGTIIPPASQPIAPENLSIENFYIIDQRIKRRRPITEQEWEQVRQWAAIQKRVRLRYIRDMAANRALERRFQALLRGKPVRKVRPVPLPYPGDPSGLTPVTRRDQNRPKGAARRGVREPIRKQSRGRSRA
jgi:hypothetical protein